MTQLALAYEPFAPAPTVRRPALSLVFAEPAPLRTRIEQWPATPWPDLVLSEYKQLAREGWDVHVLVAPDHRSLVFLACHGGKGWA